MDQSINGREDLWHKIEEYFRRLQMKEVRGKRRSPMGETEESRAGSLDLQSFLGLIQALYPSPKKLLEDISWHFGNIVGSFGFVASCWKLFSIHLDPAFIPNALARVGGLSGSQQMAKQDSCQAGTFLSRSGLFLQVSAL